MYELLPLYTNKYFYHVYILVNVIIILYYVILGQFYEIEFIYDIT